MKLRIRSLETKDTIRVEIADSSSLLDLKTLISGKLSLSPPPSPPSIAVSLNRKDELLPSSPADTLQSLGLTSGDLVFYTLTQTLDRPPNPPNSETKSQSISAPTISDPIENMDVGTQNEAPLTEKSAVVDEAMGDSTETLVSDMEIEAQSTEKSKPPSVPCFLKRVLDMEKEEIKGNLGFLIVAVHAVLLESGFVACDGEGSRLPKDWNLGNGIDSIRYTVPELLGRIQERDVIVAALKFSPMMNHVLIYGYLSGVSDIYRLHLDLSKVVPLMVFLSDRMNAEEEKDVFEFWKTVKDGLCLPLLIDICEKNGLPPPPCFARLPTDLKFKVLELLRGDDVARVGCAGSEMKYLTSNDELWKQKFMEEFGRAHESEAAAVRPWKEKFKRCWIKRRDKEKIVKSLLETRYHSSTTLMPRYAPFNQPRFPFVGGDYDRFPAIGDLGPMGPGLGFPRLPARRFFTRQCNLGGHSDNLMG